MENISLCALLDIRRPGCKMDIGGTSVSAILQNIEEVPNSNELRRLNSSGSKIGIEYTLCCALNCKSAHFLSTFDFTQKRLALRYKLRHLQWGVDGGNALDLTCAAQQKVKSRCYRICGKKTRHGH